MAYLPPISKPRPKVFISRPAQESSTPWAKGEAHALWSHSRIHNRITIVLGFSNTSYEHQRRLLGEIFQSVPLDYCDLRATYDKEQTVLADALQSIHKEGFIHRLHPYQADITQGMAEAFADPVGEWLVWIADIMTIRRDSNWVRSLLQAIITSPVSTGLLGNIKQVQYSISDMKWIATRPWYLGREFQLRPGLAAPNGNRVYAPDLHCFVVKASIIPLQQIPDLQLFNRGPWVLAEQVWQSGHTSHAWNSRGQFIRIGIFP